MTIDTSADAVEREAEHIERYGTTLSPPSKTAALLRALVAGRDHWKATFHARYVEDVRDTKDAYARGWREGAEKMRDRSANIAATEGWQGAVGRMGSYDEGALDRADEIATAIRALPLPEPQA